MFERRRSSDNVAVMLYASPNGLHALAGVVEPPTPMPVPLCGSCGRVPPPDAKTEEPCCAPKGFDVLAYWAKAVVEAPGGGVAGGVGSRTLGTPNARLRIAGWDGVDIRDGPAEAAMCGSC